MNLSESLKIIKPEMKKDGVMPVGGWQNNDYIAFTPGINGDPIYISTSYVIDKKNGKYIGKYHDVFGKMTSSDGNEISYDFATISPISKEDIEKATKFTI